MNTGAKLAAFAAVVIAVFGGAAAIGAAVGPIDVGTNAGHGTHVTNAALAIPEPSSTATVAGYSVTLTGRPLVGDSVLGFTVDIDGTQVQTEPYLGAAGHLVAIRSGDLAYLHVHPHDGDTTSVVTFTVEFPTTGVYRLFFDFSHNGTVHTAAFTVDITDPGH